MGNEVPKMSNTCDYCTTEGSVWVWSIPQTLDDVILCESCFTDEAGFTPQELELEEYPETK